MTKEAAGFTLFLLFVFVFFILLPHVGVGDFIGGLMWAFVYIGIPAAIIIAVIKTKT